ncbi:hypothetical protein [Pseudobacteriovorax antillogorgiicola]|uniref:Lipoprotein n=1 Tax=Pseudobacteriovorax antillogorgiicola TaxID=1513793 RepID=A0A1Y6CRA4_9BACT|nr:hypothetical protein [Pseudobacteriovorax antillogorgiicola]TCS45688.1 hypothetical protein EDD56_12782 [Pseudobacteriovorax antillogorgiicola]SMF73253.1 hypothetical protein SAMN06296036_12781 [Pseudobacteriovorax antillogorgiicola]
MRCKLLSLALVSMTISCAQGPGTPSSTNDEQPGETQEQVPASPTTSNEGLLKADEIEVLLEDQTITDPTIGDEEPTLTMEELLTEEAQKMADAQNGALSNAEIIDLVGRTINLVQAIQERNVAGIIANAQNIADFAAIFKVDFNDVPNIISNINDLVKAIMEGNQADIIDIFVTLLEILIT